MIRSGVVGLALALLTALTPAAVAAPPQGIRASYANPVLRTDKSVDVAATINRLRAMNVNTYAFRIKDSNEWPDLQNFLPAAQTAGINVWVYLLPPSSCPSTGTNPENKCDLYKPYFDNYVYWADGIADLAERFPRLTGWAIDDFSSNFSKFTPDYTRQIRAAGRGLDFYPVVYAKAITSDFATKYADHLDGLIFPYRDDPYRNTLWTESLRAQLTDFSRLLAPKKLILMVYAYTLSNTVITPDVEYVTNLTALGMQYTADGTIAGVIQYALPLTEGKKQDRDVPVSHGTGRGALVLSAPAHKQSVAGNYAAASTPLRLNDGSTSCRMQLWHTDDNDVSDVPDVHIKQVYVAGHLVWSSDAASDGTGWYSVTLDNVAQHLSNGVGTLTLRLFRGDGLVLDPVLARFDDIELIGCRIANPSFETTGGWTFTRSGGYLLSGQHTYDPVYSTTVHTAVAQLYGQTARK